MAALHDMDKLYELAQCGNRCAEIPAAVHALCGNQYVNPVKAGKLVQPALNVAAVNGCVDAVSSILGAMPTSSKPLAARKALLRAARHGECGVLQVCIDLLEPAQTRSLAPQAIPLAARGNLCNDFEGVLRMLTAACGADNCGLETAVISAAASASEDVVRSLLAAKAPLNGDAITGTDLLRNALFNTDNCLGVMRLLLEAKADVNDDDPFPTKSVLYMAVRNPDSVQDHSAVVRLLLSAGARADVKPSPLVPALRAQQLDMDIIRALLDAKADTHVYSNHKSAMGMLLAVYPINKHFVVAPEGQLAREHTDGVAKLLLRAKASVTLHEVKVASGNPHTLSTLMLIMGSCADRLGAKFTALSHVLDQDKMERLLETHAVAGDVSDVEAAHPGELCNAHCRKSGSVSVLTRLVSMKACVDTAQFKAIPMAARSNDPRVLDFIKAQGACMDEATLRLAKSYASIASAGDASAWIKAQINLRKQDEPSDEKRCRTEAS